jgi:GNAT superfamily N-acetyltransferase
MDILRARPEDARELTSIAFAVKGAWAYPCDPLRCWEDALTITPDYVRTHPTSVAVANERIVGFCALLLGTREALLDHLWILPAASGGGTGRALLEGAKKVARPADSAGLKVGGEPAAGGYPPAWAPWYGGASLPKWMGIASFSGTWRKNRRAN